MSGETSPSSTPWPADECPRRGRVGSGGDCAQLAGGSTPAHGGLVRPGAPAGLARGPRARPDGRRSRRVPPRQRRADRDRRGVCGALPCARLRGRARRRRRAGRPDGPGDLRLEDGGDAGGPRLDRQDRPSRHPRVRLCRASRHRLHGPAAPRGDAGHGRALRLLPGLRRRLPGRCRTGRDVERRPSAERPLRLRCLRCLPARLSRPRRDLRHLYLGLPVHEARLPSLRPGV